MKSTTKMLVAARMNLAAAVINWNLTAHQEDGDRAMFNRKRDVEDVLRALKIPMDVMGNPDFRTIEIQHIGEGE